MPKYSTRYVPRSSSPNFPVLDELYKQEQLELSFHELLQLSEEMEITVSPQQAVTTEKATRGQSGSKLWYRMRAGRVTASRLKAVCRTDPAMPSMSLIMSVCHPELSKFSTTATQW
jgi:hypothetical protein